MTERTQKTKTGPNEPEGAAATAPSNNRLDFADETLVRLAASDVTPDELTRTIVALMTIFARLNPSADDLSGLMRQILWAVTH